VDATAKLLQELTNANGVSGYETEVRKIMKREMKGLTDKIETDKLGSVLGHKKGTAANPRVMVAAHMDEIGFMVKEFTKEGYIKFLPLGGWWGHVALGQRMRILTSNGPVIGVIGSTPPHLLSPEDRKKVLEIKEMFIDVGVQEEFDPRKKLGVRSGDPIVPDSDFMVMSNPDMYMAKAFDNRMACGVVLGVLQQFSKTKHPNTILAAASVQEEVGLRGAQTIAHLGEPDVAIIVDTGIGQDIPPDGFKKTEKMGAGPAVLLYDAGMIPNIKLRNLVTETAEAKKIPYHMAYMERGATDGGRIHVSRIGVPTVVIGPPVRYIHSHNSILYRPDYDNTIKLACEVIKKLDAGMVASLTEG
jgi:endoglucanase